MPFAVPIILGGVAACSALFGAGKGCVGIGEAAEAKKTAQEAQVRLQKKVDELDSHGRGIASTVSDFGTYIIELKISTRTRYVDYLKRLNKKVIEKAPTGDVPEFNQPSLPTLSQSGSTSMSPGALINGLRLGLGAGKALASGSIGMAGRIGVASTGTAISELSGAAATNATLAWLGGGSLASGGGGMALGSLVLNGITVAPGALLMGLALAKEGQRALTQAKQYDADVNVENAKMDSQMAFMRRVQRRVVEMQDLLGQLDERANAVMTRLVPESIDVTSKTQMSEFAVLTQIMKAMAEVINAVVNDEEGLLTGEGFLYRSGRIRHLYRDWPI